MNDKRQRRIAFIILFTGIALHLIALNARSGDVRVSPDTLTTYAAVARLPASGGWRYLRDGSHVSAGYTDIKCDSRGTLWLYYEPLQSIASVWVDPDETLARRGILAGASVNRAYTRILFTRITSDGPKAISCSNTILRGDLANIWVGVVGVPYP